MRARIVIAAAMTLAALPAFAAGTNSVSAPIGALAAQILSVIEPLVLSLLAATLTWLMAKLGPEVAKSLHAAHVDREIARAIDAGFGLVEGAAKGKVLEVPIANKVIRRAVQCLVDEAPGLFKELGESLGPILVAKLSASGALPPGASAGNLDLNPYPDMKKEAAG
ncbi:MAG: hypothetical protein ACREHV_14920 [Rhizomicrobium sp.]